MINMLTNKCKFSMNEKSPARKKRLFCTCKQYYEVYIYTIVYIKKTPNDDFAL